MDLRIEKTYKALITAFGELLEERPYEQITVAMLCERAMIRRTTFYKHFADKAEFFVFFADNMRFELMRIGDEGAERMVADGGFDEHAAVFHQLADYLLKHEAAMDNIFASSMVGAMTIVVCEKAAEVLRERYASQVSDPESEDFLVACEFAAGGIIRLLQMWWESEGRSESEDRFVEASVRLVARTLSEHAAGR